MTTILLSIAKKFFLKVRPRCERPKNALWACLHTSHVETAIITFQWIMKTWRNSPDLYFSFPLPLAPPPSVCAQRGLAHPFAGINAYLRFYSVQLRPGWSCILSIFTCRFWDSPWARKSTRELSLDMTIIWRSLLGLVSTFKNRRDFFWNGVEAMFFLWRIRQTRGSKTTKKKSLKEKEPVATILKLKWTLKRPIRPSSSRCVKEKTERPLMLGTAADSGRSTLVGARYKTRSHNI